ncbi:GH25 family lysozyme [Parablautia intestinalis]|uniref:GH25 family lysozyme n=1 Tax=Parablautia intestinalis TaxID=2320100 RepID=UPI00259D28B7|nr:GH25 family lysozyme [Parablautia intestinalis]
MAFNKRETIMKKSGKRKPIYRENFFKDEPDPSERDSNWEEEFDGDGMDSNEEDSDDEWDIDWKEETDTDNGIDKKLVRVICLLGACIVVALGTVFFIFLRESKKEREALEARLNLTQEQVSQEEMTGDFNSSKEENAGKEQSSNSDEEPEEKQEAAEALPSPLKPEEVSVGALDDAQDPQTFGEAGSEGAGAEVTVSDIGKQDAAGLISGLTVGIDVSKYQGTIDWLKVKESGVEFAMIRVGYRAKSTGEIFEDPTARYNMQEAQAAGIKLGAYFFSSAVTEAEAREEAAFTCDMIAKYKITYPVAFNCEDFQSPDSRQHSLDVAARTSLACAFLDEIAASGYTPMFYASKGELEGSALWDTQTLAGKYKIWVAQYPGQPYPETSASSYTGVHDMWQYTSQGTVAGISKKTDVNIAYFGYTKEAEAKDDTPAEIVEANPEVGIIFTEVNETVTAKQETNMRSEPSTLSDASIVGRLVHGDTATRTGIGHNGWSRLIYNGQTLYAVTSYLTTDMEDTGQQAPPQGPVYTPVSEQVTAKMETNLRSEPGTDREDTIVGLLHNGEVLTRVGIGDNGWSQLEFNGQIVYAVSSYLSVVQ